jgi:hypothetical protein
MIKGMDRSAKGNSLVIHLYDGDFHDPGLPMCMRGWNRDNNTSYSIFRNRMSKRGLCKICELRAAKGLKGIQSKNIPKE